MHKFTHKIGVILSKLDVTSLVSKALQEVKMVTLSEDQAYGEIQPHVRRIWDCITKAYQRYREEYPDILLHRKATRANIVNDLIFANVITEFDDVAGTRILSDETQNVRFLSLSDVMTLWFKKLDENRESSNVSTKRAEQMNRGQLNLFGEAALIVAGYQLNKEETAVRCISFSPPNLVRPRWFIDVEALAQPIEMNKPQPVQRGVRLRITKGPEQIIL